MISTDVNEILGKLSDLPKEELDEIKKAFYFSKEAHKDQKRYSGDPYFIHPYEATKILIDEMKVKDKSTIIATLLHDVCEDGHATLDEIRKEFGDEVAFLVDGVTKLGTVKYKGIERHVENLRKMLLSMAKDIRVIIIKLADRTHNMLTLDAVPERKRERIAKETLEIYVPLADRLGIGHVKGILEDLSFKYAYPKEYNWVKGLIKDEREKQENYLKKVKERVAKELAKHNIEIVKIDSRVKNLYSVYKKLLKKDNDITRIYDIIAVRIITKNIEDCYSALGVIHRLWKPVPGKIKDYIALPKPNGYQSIHTTVFCIDGKITEFQIRTEQMHQEAENGIVAHWAYSMAGKPEEGAKVTNNIKWIQELREWQKEMNQNSEEFLNSLKIDFFKDRIFVFTPKGDVIDLPDGATPVDFAYQIHSEVGDHCFGAKVNGKMVSLDYKLQNGEICEILTNPKKHPSRDWLKFVKTQDARNRIRSYLKKHFGIEIPPLPNLQKIKNIELRITTQNRVGMLKDILSVIQNFKINITKVNTEITNKKRPVVIIEFPTKSNQQQEQVIAKISKIKGVKDIKKSILK